MLQSTESCTGRSGSLRPVLFVNTNGTFAGDSARPEAIEIEGSGIISIYSTRIVRARSGLRSNRTVMCNQQPVAQNTLQEDILDSEQDGLCVEAQLERQSASSDGTGICISFTLFEDQISGKVVMGTHIGNKTLTNSVTPISDE